MTRPRPQQYGPVTQDGSLDGILVSIGGADKTIPIRIQTGDIEYSNIDTDRDTARHLAKHLLGPIRVFGTGRWMREKDGSWTLMRFNVRGFEALRGDGLRDVIDDLRAIEKSGWADMADPLAQIRALRDESSTPRDLVVWTGDD
ncbi:hypothetical protein [Herbaspirillum sp.]|uniref:hypothetical protein n=1 Tax=Herbaspirillum sp. TaxID=1890675 RepID=UPI002582CA16|nr:hypothetical protein [Herbaspirillum sp.]MCP3947340.1 hypothetical protein [Herbaspirillum sp.]